MRLPEIAIENFRFTLLALILLVIMGAHSFVTMPRYEDPQFGSPGLVVYFIYPGASPLDIESQVINPIEKELREIKDLERVITLCFEGVGTIAFKYDYGVDYEAKYNEIIRAINSIRESLPDDLAEIRYEPISTESVNVFQLGLVSDTADYGTLEKEANELKQQLEQIQGILQVDVHGVPDKKVIIDLNPNKLALLGIPLLQIAGAIRSNNEVIPSGNLEVGNRDFSVISDSRYRSIDEILQTVIHGGEGKLLLLKDVANISFDYEKPNYLARYNGKKCVFITAQQKAGSNIRDISLAVEEVVSNQKSQLLQSIELVSVFDQSISVKQRGRQFFLNLFQGVLLVGLIITIFVGFRASLVIMLAVPISILIGIGLVDLNDFGIQQITIAGLIVALGMLVDNAIVVTENVVRLLEEGYSPKEAAKKGAAQVGWPIVSSTITTILAFIPLANIQDASGDFIKSLPITVIFTLSASLLVALTITPYVTSILFKSDSFAKKNKVQKYLDSFIDNQYRRSLDAVLRNKSITLIMAALLFIFSLYVFTHVGISFFPNAEKPILMINVYAPYGNNIDYTDAIVRKVEQVLEKEPMVTSFASNVGKGNPKIYYNHFPVNKARDQAEIFVNLSEYNEKDVAQLKKKLRNEFDDYPGVKIKVKELEQGPPTESTIGFRIQGPEFAVLQNIAQDFEHILQGTQGVRDIDNQSKKQITSLEVKIDKSRAGLLGVSATDINQSVRAAIDGLHISDYQDVSGDEFKIILRYHHNDSAGVDVFNHLYVSSLTGAQIPINQVAQVQFKSSPYLVKHFRLSRSEMVNADAEEGYNVNELTNQILEKLEAYPFPKGYSYIVAGEKEKLTQSLQGVGIAAIIAFIGIFAVLVIQFRSFIQPLIIYSALPFGIIGSVFTLLILGFNFSFTAFVGLTSLIGIVVNDSILLIDFANQLKREGKDTFSAIHEAALVRFVPILLTSLTTIAGLLPLTLRGGTLWAPMGWVIIGGLTVSTLLVLYIVPVLYVLYSKDD